MISADSEIRFDVRQPQQQENTNLFTGVYLGGILLLLCCLGLAALVIQCRELVVTLKRRRDDDGEHSSNNDVQSMEKYIRNHYKKSFEEVASELEGLRSLQHEVTSQLDELKYAVREIEETAKVASQLRRGQGQVQHNEPVSAADKKER